MKLKKDFFCSNNCDSLSCDYQRIRLNIKLIILNSTRSVLNNILNDLLQAPDSYGTTLVPPYFSCM